MIYYFLGAYLVTCKRLLQKTHILRCLGTSYNLMNQHWFKRLKEAVMPLASIEQNFKVMDLQCGMLLPAINAWGAAYFSTID